MKKLFSLVLSVVFLFSLAAPVSAAAPLPTIEAVIQEANQYGPVPRSFLSEQASVSLIPLQPSQARYTYVSYVAAGFLIEDGTAYCGGIVSLYEPLDFDYKIQLQKKSGSSWTNVKTWTHSGNEHDSTEDSYKLTQSGEYRCCVTAYVKNANGVFVEKVPCTSGSEYYSK